MAQKHKSARSYFVGKNFMTPNVMRVGFKGRYAYELSCGTGLDGETPLYGVTLANRNTGESCHDESRSFDNLSAAQSYIANLADA